MATAEQPPFIHRIGVISDTHNRYKSRVAELFADVEEIWHLGDCCDEKTLDELRALTDRLTVVLGNNDFGLDYPMTRTLVRGGESFYLIHILPHHLPQNVDWVLFGHTHRPENVMEQGKHLFNPGSAGLANKGKPLSVGLLTQREGQAFTAEVILLGE